MVTLSGPGFEIERQRRLQGYAARIQEEAERLTWPLECQVQQTATGADITMRTAFPIDTDVLTSELVDSLAALGLQAPDVRVALVEVIPRPGNAGKVRTFVPLTGQS